MEKTGFSKEGDKMANINIRVPVETLEKLKALARLNGVSLSDYVRGILAEKEESALNRANFKSNNDEIVKLRIQQTQMENALRQLTEVFSQQMEETQVWIRTTLLLATTKENVIEAYKQAKGGG